jgi:hypothetical protein
MPVVPAVVPAPGQPRRPITVYECVCGYRALGEQRCEECGSFMSRVGVGGPCPNCDEPVAVAELVRLEVMATPVAPSPTNTTTTKR